MGISSGRIIDNAGLKRLAIGTEDFEAVIGNYVYVDKSLLVRDLIDRREFGATLFCRPRRFGKSLAMRMLQCYFEAPAPEAGIPDRSHLFAGLAIMQAGERYTREQGAHPVIYLSLGEARGKTWEEVFGRIAEQMAGEFMSHAYLAESASLLPAERQRIERVVVDGEPVADLPGSLAWLSSALARHHGARTVILIDEYDAPVTEGHLNGFRDEAVTFYRTWLTGALKATTSLYLGVLTGVQRVSRESIFSGLNNITVDTALNHRFSEAFGFTEEEAEELAEFCGKGDRLGEMRDWYDGYVFGGERVYNPWSLLNFLVEGGVAQPYWGNTSSNAVVHDLFAQAEGVTRGELEALAAGGTVSEPIDLATVFDMIGRDPQAIWSQLYLAGYLTTADTAEPNNARMPRELRVPNREVGLLYRDEFYERSLRAAGDRSRLDALHRALMEGDAPALEVALRRILLDSPSALDLVRENSYRMLLVGLLYYVYGYRFPLSNREAGDGRADIVLVPERENVGKLPGIVLEVKHARDPNAALAAGPGAAADDAAAPAAGADAGAAAFSAGPGAAADDAALAQLAADALAQARSRDYADALPEGPRLTWGVAFSGKQAAALCESR